MAAESLAAPTAVGSRNAAADVVNRRPNAENVAAYRRIKGRQGRAASWKSGNRLTGKTAATRGKRAEMDASPAGDGLRHARMPHSSIVLMSSGPDSWHSEIEDISASGVLVRRPAGWKGEAGQLFALDMLIGSDLNIHLEAHVARMTTTHIGFAYARIPADKEAPLWNLLGGYADRLERFGEA